MKAVLSEIELRESIRRALMKSLMMEEDGPDTSGEPEAEKTFRDKLGDLSRALLSEKVPNILIQPRGQEPSSSMKFQFDENFGAWAASSPVFYSDSGYSLQRLMNSESLKQALENLGLASGDFLKLLFEIQSGTQIADAIKAGKRSFYQSLRMQDSGPAGLDFLISEKANGSIIGIYPSFSALKMSEFIVGARQKGLYAGPDLESPFPQSIETIISDLVPTAAK